MFKMKTFRIILVRFMEHEFAYSLHFHVSFLSRIQSLSKALILHSEKCFACWQINHLFCHWNHHWKNEFDPLMKEPFGLDLAMLVPNVLPWRHNRGHASINSVCESANKCELVYLQEVIWGITFRIKRVRILLIQFMDHEFVHYLHTYFSFLLRIQSCSNAFLSHSENCCACGQINHLFCHQHHH